MKTPFVPFRLLTAPAALLLSALLLAVWMTSPARAQLAAGGVPPGLEMELPVSGIPLFDLGRESGWQPQRLPEKDRGSGPMPAGSAVAVSLGPGSHGRIVPGKGNTLLWQLKLHASGALGLGLVFDAFELAKGARLFVYSPCGSVHAGAFTPANNHPSGVFSTRIIPGDTLVVELEEPLTPGGGTGMTSRLQIGELIFIDGGGGGQARNESKQLGSSDDCHININCPEGNLWQDQKRGVVRILLREGTRWWWCSGSLVNNTARDGAPLMLTSDHCGEAASDADYNVWQFYFNYERPGCPDTGTPPNQMLTGSSFRARGALSGGSDFKLLMLNHAPPETFAPYYNGWSLSETASPSGAGIHHPAGDAKKISTYTMPLSATTWPGGLSQGFWQLTWAATESGHGVTAGGSSGSPLFNHQGLIVGTFSGGVSECGGPFGPDLYGRMDRHWIANGTADSRRLKPWLDPLGLEPTALGGFDPYGSPYDPPLSLEAEVVDDEVKLSWKPPGYIADAGAWFAYNTEMSHLSWQQPQRATLFSAADFDLSYPVSITRLAHYFYEHSEHPWPGDGFDFKIYDADGESLLYESVLLTAISGQPFVYTLDQPLEVAADFYVAVAPAHNSGHPSSVMKLMDEAAHSQSVIGSPGNWNPYVGDEGYFEFYMMVHIGGDKSRSPAQWISSPSGSWPSARRLTPTSGGSPAIRHAALGSHHGKADGEPALSGFGVYRDNALLAIIDDPGMLNFTDSGLEPGQYAYFVTALYDDTGESERSNTVFALVEEPVVLYEAVVSVTDQHGQPLEGAEVTVTPYVEEADELFYENWEGYGDFVTDLSPWHTEDPIGELTYGAETFSFPGATQPFAFMSFNPFETSPPIDHPPVDGSRYVVAISSAHSPTRDENKWLISPAVSIEGAARLSFYAKSITAQYGLERIRVLVSTSGDHPDDFIHELSPDPYIEVPQSWTTYHFDLGDFVGKEIHFAVHYVSHDAFILMLDALRIGGGLFKEEDSLTLITVENGQAVFMLPDGMYQYRVRLPGYSGAREVFILAGEDAFFDAVLSDLAYALNLEVRPENGGVAIDRTDAAPYAPGTQISVEAIPAPDFLFAGWSRDEDSDFVSTEPEYSFEMGAADLTLTAHFESDPTFVHRPSAGPAIKVFPNPASRQLTVTMQTGAPIRELRLVNMLGQVVLTLHSPGEHTLVADVSFLPGGIYIVQATTENGLVSSRVRIRR